MKVCDESLDKVSHFFEGSANNGECHVLFTNLIMQQKEVDVKLLCVVKKLILSFVASM